MRKAAFALIVLMALIFMLGCTFSLQLGGYRGPDAAQARQASYTVQESELSDLIVAKGMIRELGDEATKEWLESEGYSEERVEAIMTFARQLVLDEARAARNARGNP